MNSYSDQGERDAIDFLKFAVGFLAFMMAAGGVVLASLGLAIFGAAVLLLVILSFLSE